MVFLRIYARFVGKSEFGFGEICVWFLEEFEFGLGGHPRLVFVTMLRLVFWRVRVWFFATLNLVFWQACVWYLALFEFGFLVQHVWFFHEIEFGFEGISGWGGSEQKNPWFW